MNRFHAKYHYWTYMYQQSTEEEEKDEFYAKVDEKIKKYVQIRKHKSLSQKRRQSSVSGIRTYRETWAEKYNYLILSRIQPFAKNK